MDFSENPYESPVIVADVIERTSPMPASLWWRIIRSILLAFVIFYVLLAITGAFLYRLYLAQQH
jgi:hypothetical protein